MNRIYLCGMRNKIILLTTVLLAVACVIGFFSWKTCKKKEAAQAVAVDTTSSVVQLQNMIDLPHADTTLIPVVSAVLDEAFEASAAKDYNRLASLLVYRGPDSLKLGYDVFNAKNKFDRHLLRITAEVFNKWNKDIESREYARVFELDQPDGRKMLVMEVIFVSQKYLDRKFFGFLQIENEWKIVAKY